MDNSLRSKKRMNLFMLGKYIEMAEEIEQIDKDEFKKVAEDLI